MDQEEYRLPPRTLFISFLLVSGGYVLSVTVLFILAYSLATVIAPDSIELAKNAANLEQQLNNNPAKVLPQKLYWPLLVLDALACLGIGFAVARFAPFAKMAHSIFLAIIIFVGFLQSAIGAPAGIQWMLIGLMASTPVATLLGGRLCILLTGAPSPENADH